MPMTTAMDFSIEDLNAADARRAAMSYVSEAFAEAVLDGIEVDDFAEAAFCAALREIVAVHGEDHAFAIARRLPDRIRAGEFSARTRQ
jgi:hypothetical protein